jgi:hypothetical protein
MIYKHHGVGKDKVLFLFLAVCGVFLFFNFKDKCFVNGYGGFFGVCVHVFFVF